MPPLRPVARRRPHCTRLIATTASVLLCLHAVAQTPTPSYPRRIEGYTFYPSLDAAAAAARAPEGKGKLVVYAVRTLQRRDRVDWIIAQESIFRHPVTRAALRGIPIVCLQDDRGEGKRLGIPASGLCILDAETRAVEHTIHFAETHARNVGPTLARRFGVKVESTTPFDGPRPERDRYRKAHNAIRDAFENGDEKAAAAVAQSALQSHPDRFVTRLLQFEYRLGAGPIRPRRSGRRQVLDRLYVVPDVRTFLATIRHWGAGPRFPILLRDDLFLPRFVAAFAPAEILYLPPASREAGPLTEAELTAAFRAALGPVPGSKTRRSGRAPGLVLTHPSSPLAAAGVALAAGHRQWLAMHAPVADPTAPVGAAAAERIRASVRARLTATGQPWRQVHDEIDFLTLATELPFRYRDEEAHDRSLMALDDFLGRDDDDFPAVFVGRLQAGEGDHPEVRGLYQAMCSLFLHVEKPLVFGHYGNRGQWAPYLAEDAIPPLAAGRPTLIARPTSTLAAWRSLFRGRPNHFDLIHVNSSGSTTEWSSAAGRGSFVDVPRSLPSIVSYVHSNSLGNGYDGDTIGGRWLRNGAYFFFGSIDEPYLDAFVPPSEAFARAVDKGQPLGMAHRRMPGSPRWRPWKLMLFGDPLLRIRFGKIPRVSTPLPETPGAVLLRDAAAANPFALPAEDRPWFALHVAGLQDDWAKVKQGFSKLLGEAPSAAWPKSRCEAAADLAARYLESSRDLATLRSWVPGLRRHAISSPALSTVGHELFAGALRDQPGLRGDPLGDLLVEHVSLRHSAAMMKQIARSYLSRLDGAQLQRVRKILTGLQPAPPHLDALWLEF